MKTIGILFFVLFAAAIVFAWMDWRVEGFVFSDFQPQHFYFQSWISLSGILFASVMAITTLVLYRQSHLRALKYIPLSFLLIALAYLIMGYHASSCKVCSDLGFCAASHNYPSYLVVIAFVIFLLSVIMMNSHLSIEKKSKILHRLSYGLIIATSLLIIALFVSIQFMETPDALTYVMDSNLQAFVFILPLAIIALAFVYFANMYRLRWVHLLMGLLASASLIPQIYHIYTCKDCHDMECSEFYVFSGLLMFLVVGLFIHALSVQLQQSKEEQE